ncbi:MAG TPA: hypothetical protein PK874_13470 [Desulfobacteraceae bacterium]|nr:hypothetical protein [Desulfobacteraceae bacterium]HPJ67143.1 hypothetical protein [Desulfobacteraceae bacterium]HPQ29339.1 hypothetical protein [Desulfobacteraceae bacterium]
MKIINIAYIIIIFLALASSPSIGEEFGRESKESGKIWSSALYEELKDGFDHDLRFIVSGTYQDVAESSQNPRNDFFEIPQYLTESQVRFDARLRLMHLDFSIKPRLNIERRQWEDGQREGDSEWKSDLYINEWLARTRMAEGLFISYGRENLQWGPSYLFSPSNPFFRDNGRSNPKREVPGMDFGRLVWITDELWTFSLIANFDKGRQDFGLFKFEKTYALKVDYAGYVAYMSLILSHREKDRTSFGAFGGWTASDALLLYAEGMLSKGTNALYPTDSANPFGASLDPIKDEDSSLNGIILAGASYTLEIGPTLTVEYIYNGLGYNNEKANRYYSLRKRASDAYFTIGTMSSLSKMILGQTADPNLRFLRRNYIMLQYLHNDIKDVLNLTFRWTRNIDDGSDQFVSIVEYYLGDHIQLFSIGTVNSGSGDTEFGTTLKCQWMLGLEYVF